MLHVWLLATFLAHGMNEVAFRKLISGQRRGPRAALARTGLTGLSLFYALGAAARNLAYDAGWLPSYKAPVPVVSLGNITAGGTGKTPVAAWLANWFETRGVKAGLLSRGYRALAEGANDERLVLDRLCPGVPHVQNADRVAGAKDAVREHGCEVLILDDGFQHRRLARDLDIVLIDALNPWGYGHLLPRGLLREPLSALRRADLIFLTRADQCSREQRSAILTRLQSVRGNADCVEIGFPAGGLVNHSGAAADLTALSGKRVLAFCGIGNPDGFRQTMRGAGLDAELRAFPDHHHYGEVDLRDLERAARESEAVACVTTQKDLVKIRQDSLAGVPLWAVQIEASVLNGNELLERWLGRVLGESECDASQRHACSLDPHRR